MVFVEVSRQAVFQFTQTENHCSVKRLRHVLGWMQHVTCTVLAHLHIPKGGAMGRLLHQSMWDKLDEPEQTHVRWKGNGFAA